jgi:colanic acid/amylovoran biosynthesis glycosyltransferase
MKVAFVVGEFPILSETFILNQITGLLSRGHEVDIYANARGDRAKIHPVVGQYKLLDRTYYFHSIPDNFLLRIIKGIFLIFLLGFQDSRKLLQAINIFKYGKPVLSLWLLYTAIPSFKKNYDIIHCQFGHQSFRAMAFRTINNPEAKLITIFRGYDISSFVEKKGIHIYDEYFLANCEFFRQKVIQLGCDPQKIVVHFSGLACDRFVYKPRHLFVNDTIYLATTGRLVEKKGIEYAIQAVAKQAKITPNIEYNIIGDGELKAKLKQLIQKLGVEKIVKLVGWKNEQEIIEILDKTQIFLAPSVTAADGNQDAPVNTLKEAMAMGLPVISTYHGGIPELVEDGISGFLVPERDAEALAQKLGYLIEHPELWQTMGKAGRDRIESSYDLDKLNDRLVKIYQKVLRSQELESLEESECISPLQAILESEGVQVVHPSQEP